MRRVWSNGGASLVAQFCQQILRMNRFGEDVEMVTAGAGVFEKLGRGRLAGKEKNFAGWQKFADVDGGVDAVHVVHHHVADDQVRTVAARSFDGSRAAVNRCRRESILVEDNRKGIGDYALVVNYQNFGFLFVVVCHQSLFRKVPGLEEGHGRFVR
jgi:hypothetical protein